MPRTAQPAWHGSAGDNHRHARRRYRLSFVTLLMTLPPPASLYRMLLRGDSSGPSLVKLAASFASFLRRFTRSVAARALHSVLARYALCRITARRARHRLFLYEMGLHLSNAEAARGRLLPFQFQQHRVGNRLHADGIGAVALMILRPAWIVVDCPRKRVTRVGPAPFPRPAADACFTASSGLRALTNPRRREVISLTGGPVIRTARHGCERAASRLVPLAAGDQRGGAFPSPCTRWAGPAPLLGLAADRLWLVRKKRVRQGMLGYAALTLIVPGSRRSPRYPLIPAMIRIRFPKRDPGSGTKGGNRDSQ